MFPNISIKLFVAATSLSKSNSVNNKNSLNNKMNNNGEKQLLTNGNNSNLINNNETIKNTNNSKVSLYWLKLFAIGTFSTPRKALVPPPRQIWAQ